MYEFIHTGHNASTRYNLDPSCTKVISGYNGIVNTTSTVSGDYILIVMAHCRQMKILHLSPTGSAAYVLLRKFLQPLKSLVYVRNRRL